MVNDTPQAGSTQLVPEVTAPSGVKSSMRTLEVLELLSNAGQRQSITAISRELGIPKSSLHGILRTMLSRGWLETDASGSLYGLGMRALLSGAAYVETDDIVALAAGALDSIALETSETTHLGRLDGPDIVYLAKRESTHALRLFSAVGRRLPAHATSLGKVLLAQLDDDEVDRRLRWPLERLTDRTIVDPAALHAELAHIRETGFAYEHGENAPGIQCIAVGLEPTRGSLNAISCSVPDTRMTPTQREVILQSLRKAAQTIDAMSHHLRRV